MAEAAYENPLIPNARLRQIYRSMVQMRMLARVLPPKARARWQAGLEACLVATSIDLGPADVVMDAFGGSLVGFLRGATLGRTMRPEARVSGRLKAECGEASALATPKHVEERLWAALGAASALKAAAAVARNTAPASDAEAPPTASVAVVYVRTGEVSAALWRTILPFAAEQLLPILFVVFPPARGTTADENGVSPLALRCGVPCILVDGDDAVAIYRVTQESVVRARMGGGPALMECVPFVLGGGTAAAVRPEDALRSLERYMLTRRVVTQRWIEGESKTFARRLAAEQARA